MKQKDLIHLETVCSLYTMCYCMGDIIDEISSEDLPEMLKEPHKALKESIHIMLKSMEKYRDLEEGTFISACEE